MVPQLEETEGVEVVRALSTRTYSMLFNNVQSGVGTPIESAQVRQALNYAVDKQAIIDTVLDGHAVAMNSFIGTIMFGYDESLPVMEYDPDRAMALLAEAGYPDGFEIDMSCPAGAYVKVEEICQAVGGYLEGVGVVPNLEIMESGEFWDREAAKTATPLFFDGWGSRALDSSDMIWGAFVPDTVVEDGSGWANWYDEHLYELWQEQAFTLDQEKREQVFHEIAAYMQEEPPAIFLWQVYNFEAIRDHVDNYTMYPDDVQYLWDVEVNK
jgi:peptide/nickel transport system substrate-binding protein